MGNLIDHCAQWMPGKQGLSYNSYQKKFYFKLKYPVDVLMLSDNVRVVALDMTKGKNF